MKIKKIIAILLSVATIGSCVVSTGCNNSSKPSSDPNTVNLMMSGGGYGTAYMDEIVGKFNELYKDEGYKINRLPTGEFGTAKALAEMRLGTDSGYDLVMPGSVYAYDALDPTFGACVECIDDVYSAKPIGFDGKEEDKTLLEKLRCDEFNYWVAQDINDVADGEWYGFFQVNAVRGVVCNTFVLKTYGGMTNFEEEYPRTTEELFAYFDAIAGNDEAQQQAIMPLIYAGDNDQGATTYSISNVFMSAGQILGKEEYNKRWENEEFFAANGNKFYQDDWKYFLEQEALIPSYEYLMQAWDWVYAVNGAESMFLNKAHSNLVLGMAAFMFDGNYFYNEVMENKSLQPYMADMRMIPYPVISYVGLKWELCGEDHNVGYGNNSGKKCANCDKIMSAIIKGYDDGKDAATIKSEVETALNVSLTDLQVEKIIEARSCGYGISEPCYIIKDSPKAEIAKLFLRMLASEDVARVREKYGQMSIYSKPQATADTPQFLADCYKIDGLRQWGVDVHGKPGNKAIISWHPGYSATIGKTIHADMDRDQTYLERDYAKMAKALLSPGGKAYEEAKNTFKDKVRTKGFEYVEADNPNR